MRKQMRVAMLLERLCGGLIVPRHPKSLGIKMIVLIMLDWVVMIASSTINIWEAGILGLRFCVKLVCKLKMKHLTSYFTGRNPLALLKDESSARLIKSRFVTAARIPCK